MRVLRLFPQDGTGNAVMDFVVTTTDPALKAVAASTPRPVQLEKEGRGEEGGEAFDDNDGEEGKLTIRFRSSKRVMF